ncbi:MAG: orotate phosphoribosyltransferase [Polyangiales bacterium]
MSAAGAALLDALRRDAWRRGRFRLASGRESDFFIDCKQVILTAPGHRLVGEALFEAIAADPVAEGLDGVAGVALGGCSLASAVSLVSAARLADDASWDALYVRKEAKDHGTAKRVEGRLRRGQRVVLVEDVLTTGGSSRTAVDALRAEGFEVDRVFALVDRGEGGVEALAASGVRATALFRRGDFVEV